MASEDNNKARHTIVVKEKEEAGYVIMAKVKEVVEAGSTVMV